MKELKPIRVSREALYQQVWETPMSQLSSQYGLSDKGLAKICKRLNIPCPGRGYWARKAAGKHVIQYQLPAPDNDTPDDVLIRPTAPEPQIAREAKEKSIAKAEEIGEVIIPQKLTSPHPIIRQWLDEHKAKRARDKERGRGSESNFYTPPLTPTEHRRHKILHVLFKHLEKNGFKIKAEQYKGAYLEYKDIRIDFVLREKLKQVRRPLTKDEKRWHFNKDRPWKQELQPTGNLIFSIKSYLESGLQREWKDNTKKSLEDCLPDIISTLTIAGPLLVKRQLQREEEARQRREEEYQRHLQNEARKTDLNQWQKFLEFSTRWQQANTARNFITALENKTSKLDSQVGDKNIDQWLIWARDWADRYDPLSNEIGLLFESISDVTLDI